MIIKVEKSLCYYHRADYDGRCSAAIIKYFDPNVKVIGVDHPASDVDFDDVDEDTTVYLVDFCLDMGDMKTIKECSKEFIWIDHHHTAIEDAKKNNFSTKGLLSIEKAACRLTWDYIFPKTKEPLAVELIGKFDVWDHNRDTIPFNNGLLVERDSYKPYKQNFWSELFNNNDKVEAILRKGRFLCSYNTIINNQTASMCAFDTSFEGYKAIAINKPMANSLVFDSVWDSDKYDMEIIFYRHKTNVWKISLYNPNSDNHINLGELAAKYGGGGHKCAAGFQCSELPFKI